MSFRIKFQQFLFGFSHSWGISSQELGRQFIKEGHDVEFISTNGLVDKFIPKDLAKYIKHQPTKDYDIQLSYTAPHNFQHYLSHGKKNRFGIWIYEWPILPSGFAQHYKFTDKILSPSEWGRQIYIENKVPADRVVTVPHGINLEIFLSNKNKYPLKTHKKYKILVNIGQQHRRKGIDLAIEGFFKAFTNKDDVCLVLKVSQNKDNQAFNVDSKQILNNYKKKFKNHPEVECLEYVDDIISLYNAVDIVYTASHCEGFYLPGLECFAASKIAIVPRYSGQLDFMNDSNSLLIDGQIVRADKREQYWQSSPYNSSFAIDTNDAARLLQKAVKEYDQLLEKFKPAMEETVKKYSWANVTKQILDLTV